MRIYNVVEYSLLAYYFSLHIRNKLVSKLLVFSPLVFTFFCLLNYLRTSEPAIPFVPLIVEYILLLSTIIYFFFEVMQESVVEPIYQRVVFWISVAFILNFSGNFFLFLYSNNSFSDEQFQRHYTIIYSTITILKNVFLCIAVLTKESKNKNENNSSIDLPIDTKLDNFLPFKN